MLSALQAQTASRESTMDKCAYRRNNAGSISVHPWSADRSALDSAGIPSGNMSDDKKPDVESESSDFVLSEDLLSDLEFGPSWASKPPQTSHEPRREDRGGGRRQPRRDDRAPRHDARRDNRGDNRHGARRDDRGPRRAMPRPLRVIPAEVEVSMIPESQRLAVVIRRIRHTKRAYPVLEVAALFTSNESASRVKITVPPERSEMVLFQCKLCGSVHTERDGLVMHVSDQHLEDHFVRDEIVGEAPGGQFVCVARCGLTGELLGPPNHHSYADRVHEVHRAKCSHVPIEEYRARIESVRDPELIEAWREQSRKQTVYRRQDKEGSEGEGETVSWSEAVAELRENVVPSVVTKVRRATLNLDVALKVQDLSLLYAIRDAMRREQHSPRTMVFALRAAFRHMGLYVFRSAQGRDFVTSVKPSPLNVEHVADSVRVILDHLKEHGDSTRQAVLEALNVDHASEATVQLGWLVDKGHVVEYSDGKLGLPGPGRERRRARAAD